MAPPTIHVEFYGVPRQRAGVAAVDVPAATLGDLFQELAAHFPAWARECLVDGELAASYTANRNGELFVRSRATPLSAGDTVLILSADAGG